MPDYVIQVGLTRRLVHAPDEERAMQLFLNDVPMRRQYLGVLDETHVREATENDILEFRRRRGVPGDDQLALVLDDITKAPRSKWGRKEHA